MKQAGPSPWHRPHLRRQPHLLGVVLPAVFLGEVGGGEGFLALGGFDDVDDLAGHFVGQRSAVMTGGADGQWVEPPVHYFEIEGDENGEEFTSGLKDANIRFR